jgi:hypothetical protein
MELIPSREASNCVANQEFPSISWNPKVHCRVHKRPPLVSILSVINAVHTATCNLYKLQINAIHPPTTLPEFNVITAHSII